jgi:hypothetical protein
LTISNQRPTDPICYGREPKISIVSWAEWTAAGVLATALFTGATALITYRSHRHSQAVSGFRNPIKVGAPKQIGYYKSGWGVIRLMNEVPAQTLALTLYMFNRSEAAQTFVLDPGACRLLRPSQPGHQEFVAREIKFDPFTGGNVQLKLGCSQPWSGGQKGRILLVATTHSGQPIRQKVRVDVKPAPRLDSYGQLAADD